MKMTLHRRSDEESSENDVRYGIAGCRERLRSQRATFRAQHQSPTDVSNGEREESATRFESYAELFATSISQSSMSRLIECLLEPANVNAEGVSQEPRVVFSNAEDTEREEAAIT
jgi:hypothetical protein